MTNSIRPGQTRTSPGFTCSNGRNAIGSGSSRGLSVFRVLDHADDLEIAGGAVIAIDAEVPADRIFVRQVALDERFVHDRDTARPRRVVFIEGTAQQKLRAECLEITRGDTIQPRERLSPGCGVYALNRDCEAQQQPLNGL